MVKEKTWFDGTAQSLEKLKIIHLDPADIAEQLYEQKVRAFLLMIYNILPKKVKCYLNLLFLNILITRFWQWRFSNTGLTLRRW